MKFQLPKLLRKSSKGFTLIELLVVIAVLGVLATIVLLAVNPAEQIARGRDSSRVSAVTQLGRALQGYFTANNASLPVPGTTWISSLVTSKDLSTIPTSPDATNYTTCPITFTPSSQGGTRLGYCYATSNAQNTEAIVYAKLESQLYAQKCTTGASTIPYWVFSTTTGRAGGKCSTAAADPTAPLTTYDFP